MEDDIDIRGIAAIGMSEYVVATSPEGRAPELLIHAKGVSLPVVRLRFMTVEGLDAFEQHLRELRAAHFAVPRADPVATLAAELNKERAAAKDASSDLC